MPAILIYLVIGVSVGAALGYFGKCQSGACPLTANWRRGALYGAVVAALFYVVFGSGFGAARMNQSTTNVRHISEADFEAEVTRATMPVVIDFYATWCVPCRQLAPLVDEVAGKYAGRIKFVKINVDESPKLAQQFQVEGIPMLAVLANGKVVDSSAGLVAVETLTAKLDQLLTTTTQTAAPVR